MLIDSNSITSISARHISDTPTIHHAFTFEHAMSKHDQAEIQRLLQLVIVMEQQLAAARADTRQLREVVRCLGDNIVTFTDGTQACAFFTSAEVERIRAAMKGDTAHE